MAGDEDKSLESGHRKRYGVKIPEGCHFPELKEAEGKGEREKNISIIRIKTDV